MSAGAGGLGADAGNLRVAVGRLRRQRDLVEPSFVYEPQVALRPAVADDAETDTAFDEIV